MLSLKHVGFALPFIFMLVLTSVGQINSQNPETEKYIILTFDDYLSETATQAVPRLTNYGWKGVSFIHILSQTSKYDSKTIMTFWSKIANAGWELGSHGVTHKDLRYLSDANLDYELRYSKEWLETNFPQSAPVISHAYPNGRYDQRILDYTAKYYQLGFKGWWTSPSWDGSLSLEIPRHAISYKNYKTEIPVALEEARRTGYTVLVFHDIQNSPGTYGLTPTQFEEALAMINASKLKVVTFKDLFLKSPPGLTRITVKLSPFNMTLYYMVTEPLWFTAPDKINDLTFKQWNDGSTNKTRNLTGGNYTVWYVPS